MKKWYAETHEWGQENAEGLIEVGISDHAQHALGDIVYVSTLEVGSTVAQGETFGDVESVKAVSELFSPVSGEVVEVNEILIDEPEKLNQDANNTWIIKVKGSLDTSKLMDEAAYLESAKD